MTSAPHAIVLDHVAFGALDCELAEGAMRELGFSLSAPSRCEWEIAGSRYAAEARCVVFSHQYLDFIQISDPEWNRHLASSALHRRGIAPTAVVLSGIPPRQAHARLASGPGPHPEPHPITRRVRTDPPIEIGYEFLPLRPARLSLGIISDPSPQALRRRAWVTHPNTALGIERVHLRVPSIREALTSLARPPLSLGSGSVPEVSLGASSLHLHEQPSCEHLAAVSKLLPRRDRPTVLALELRVASSEAAAHELESRGVRFATTSRKLVVDPDQGFGIGIVLREGAGR